MATPYTREEIEAIGDGLPQRGVYCPKCMNYTPVFADLTEDQETELRRLSPIHAIKRLREITGCSLTWAKLWHLHRDGPHTPDPDSLKACLFCGAQIGIRARQCTLCKMDWHDPGNPVRNGLSIADEILGAPAGSIISIQGGNAYSTAIAYAEANRPDAGLRFEIIPLENDKKQLKK